MIAGCLHEAAAVFRLLSLAPEVGRQRRVLRMATLEIGAAGLLAGILLSCLSSLLMKRMASAMT